MQTATALKLAIPAALVGVLVAINCTGTNQWSTDRPGDWGESRETQPACDPDGMAPCPDDWFLCVEDGAGNKHCEGQQSATPDESGGWDCEVQGTTLVCRGDHLPGDAGDWLCSELAPGEVVCRRHAYVPAGEGTGEWSCHYEGDRLICEFDGADGGSPPGEEPPGRDAPPGGSDGCPPGVEAPSEEVCGDGVDNDCDGWVDEHCADGPPPVEPPPDTPPPDEPPPVEPPPDTPPGPPGCLCIPGAWRYCDTPTYCRWGIQYCAADGMSWGRCNETSPPLICMLIASWYSPEAEACCIASGFCCQDMWDLDFDGDTWESLGDCTDIECV